MNKLTSSILLLILINGCKKDNSSNALVEPICYQGIFLNGIICNDDSVSAVQVIDPQLSLDTFHNANVSYIARDGKHYNQAIALVIPPEFRDGSVFYFTIDTLYSPPYTADCYNVPNVTGRLKSISRSSCQTPPL